MGASLQAVFEYYSHYLLSHVAFFNLIFASVNATVHISAFLSNMAECTDGKNLETQLKKVALASACTLTGPTGYQNEEPNNGSFVRLTARVAP